PSPATPRTSAPLDEGADEPPPAEPLAVELQRQTWAESQIEAPDLPAEPVRAPAETDAATPTPPVEAPAEVNAADALPNDTPPPPGPTPAIAAPAESGRPAAAGAEPWAAMERDALLPAAGPPPVVREPTSHAAGPWPPPIAAAPLG